MIRMSVLIGSAAVGAPRVSGDDPTAVTYTAEAEECSPRERG